MIQQALNYAAMSKTDLIEIIENQKTIIQKYRRIAHLPNSVCSPGEKLFWPEAHAVINQEKADENGMVRLPIDKIAERINMSETTAGRYAHNLLERFGAYHDTIPYTTKKGQTRFLLYVNKNDQLWEAPWDVDIPEEQERTINGNLCPHCRSSTYRVKKRTIASQEIGECDTCHYKKVYPVVQENIPEEPMEYKPEPKGFQAEEPLTEEANPDSETLEQEEQVQEEKAQKYEATSVPITHTHPNFCTTEKGFQAEEPFCMESWLQQRIGHKPLIVSTGNLENSQEHPKYYTKPLEYVPHIAAYLRGDRKHIYGSRPALPDGTTWLMGFDIENPEFDKSHKYMMFRLALAGIASVYWKRREGRGHLEIYLDKPVDRHALYAYLIRVCPELAAIPEVFPVGSDQNTNGVDRSDYGYSWPLFYRIEDQVIESAAHFMFADRPGELVESPGYRTDRAGLLLLLSRSITPATLIPARPQTAEETEKPLQCNKQPTMQEQEAHVLLLDKKVKTHLPGKKKDIMPDVLAEWNKAHDWHDIIALCGGLQKNKHFLAVWRSEKTASVKVDPDGCYACDYGDYGDFPKKLDKFEVWCLAQGKNPTEEKNLLISEYRQCL